MIPGGESSQTSKVSISVGEGVARGSFAGVLHVSMRETTPNGTGSLSKCSTAPVGNHLVLPSISTRGGIWGIIDDSPTLLMQELRSPLNPFALINQGCRD